MSDLDKSFEAAMAATAEKSSGGYYLAEPTSEGSFNIFAADPVAKQIFWGWGSDRNPSEIARYGREAKGARRPVKGQFSTNRDYLLWVWTLTPLQAGAFLKDLKSAPATGKEKPIQKELEKLLAGLATGKLPAPKKVGKGDTALDKSIIEGMARLAWANEWGNEQERKLEDGGDADEAYGSGVDIYDAAPKTPRAAYDWAKKVGAEIAKSNNATLTQLFELAQASGFSNDAEAFGSDLAHQAIGTGVRWTDRLSSRREAKIDIKVPSREFYY